MSPILRKFVLVLWKNLILRKRHWILTIFEIIIPTALFILCAVLQSDSVNTKVDTKYYELRNEDLTDLYIPDQVLYAPNTSFANNLMENIASKWGIDILDFPSEYELLEYYYKTISSARSSFGIVFEQLPENGNSPQNLKYKIRSSEQTFYTTSTFRQRFSNGPGIGSYLYTYTGFTSIQMIVEKTFIDIAGAEEGLTLPTYQYNVQQFPHPAYNEEIMQTIFAIMLPFYTLLSFILLCPSIIKRIVEEKETGVKELMKMMGLKDWMLWLGWFINALLVNIVSISIIVLILKLDVGDHAIMERSDWFLLWLFLFFYCLAGISFCFAVSSLFDRPTLAMSIGIVLWILSYSTLSFLTTSDVEVDLSVKLLSSLLPNMAISWGYKLIMDFESNNLGLTWDNLLETTSTGGDYSMGHVWLMLIVDVFIYNVLAWYIGNIVPGKYGIAKPWYFIFMPAYWLNKRDSDIYTSGETSVPASKFEKPPSNLAVGIKIQNLRKVFQTLAGTNKKVAVDGVTLDIYRGEITALLGHNGAGKTTTMSILTGLISPSSGSVHIDGYDIKDNLEKVRESLGLCPQHNMLFTDLTVLEHLIFFAMLKGLSKQEATTESFDLLVKLNLVEKKNNMASALSGGMKRKLSLGIALIGRTEVLMLDEPTSGLDPEARREIWDILLKMRGERTILITTHFMEEADVLGDRIAIMDHGKVECFGTSLFLKKIYGTGYQLNLLKAEHCQIHEITSTIKSIISGAQLKTDMGSFLSYMLPTDESNHFSELFDTLEKNKHALGISSIGVSITTLEEVFLRVGMEAEDKHNSHSHVDVKNGHMMLNGNAEALTYFKRSGIGLHMQQFNALLKKRIICAYRNWIGLSIQIVITVLMTVFTLILGDSFGLSNEPEPALTLNLDLYGATQALYFDPTNTFGATYEKLIKDAGSRAVKVTQVNEELLKVGRRSFNEYFSRYVIATEFNSTNSDWQLNAMFSSVALHSYPISVNMLSNTILEYYNIKKSITVINHPLERLKEENSGISDGLPLVMMWVSVMPLGLLFLVGSFIKFPLLERVSKAKQLQLMSGTSALTYWLSYFLLDILIYLIVAAFLVLMVFVSDPLDIFNGSTELGVYFFMLVMYGIAALPYAYLFSYFRKTNAGCYSLFVILNMLVGMILSLVVYFMLLSPSYEDIATGLKYIFEFFPQFSMSFGLMKFSNLVYNNNVCKLTIIECKLQPDHTCCSPSCEDGYCPAIYKPYLEFSSSDNTDAIGLELLFLGIDFLIYIGLIMLIEFNVFGNFNAYLMRSSLGTNIEEEPLEEDVMKEKQRINSLMEGTVSSNTDDIMLVDNLVKKFKRNFVAVKGVSFGVSCGECFGLLGVNGAGKTTTFRMLTGDEFQTSGNALINEYSLTGNKGKFVSQIGYCPQFDAITEALTGREMLTLFANLRGIPHNNINHQVNKWLFLMGLDEYKDRQCGTYSGGNKRKLSTAMSLIGDPPIIFLDEPTSGVDPVARRNLWNVLTNIQKTGQSVVLTSHSMEECEALCNRLAIMVRGQFMCMGGIQYLKQRFGQGFTIMIKLRATEFNADDVNKVKNQIQDNFKSKCVLKDEHQGLLHYHVTDSSVPWKYLFRTMEAIKHDFTLVEDYTISETTLEQVFLSFARAQPNEMSTDL